ncbi:MAG: hypothetical protein ACREJX_22330 [Polyangiaceae bacterium]
MQSAGVLGEAHVPLDELPESSTTTEPESIFLPASLDVLAAASLPSSP